MGLVRPISVPMLGPKAFLAAPAASLGDTAPDRHRYRHWGLVITSVLDLVTTSVPISVGTRPISVPIFGLDWPHRYRYRSGLDRYRYRYLGSPLTSVPISVRARRISVPIFELARHIGTRYRSGPDRYRYRLFVSAKYRYRYRSGPDRCRKVGLQMTTFDTLRAL